MFDNQINPPLPSRLSTHHMLYLWLFLFPVLSVAQADITVGSSLTAVNGNSSWLSPSGDFAFGFRSLYNGNNAKDERLFLLSIWYNKVPSETIVWFANGDRPAPENSKLALTSNLGFVLTNP